jgi:hypothetical protein
MTKPDETLLILGIILFAVLVVVLVVFLVQGKNVTALLAFFILPIGMIGFSEIKDWKGPWGEIQTKGLSDYASNPNASTNVVALNQTLDQIASAQAANPNQPIPAPIHSNLVATVRMASLRTHLTPESQLALSRAQFFLGETNDAIKSVNLAVAANTNLIHAVDPRMKIFLRPSIH